MVFFLIPVLFVLTTAIHMGVFLYLNPDGLGSNGLPKGYIGTERTRRGSAVIIGVGLWLILLPFNMFAFSALFQSMESTRGHSVELGLAFTALSYWYYIWKVYPVLTRALKQ